MWSALIIIFKAEEKLNLCFALSVREERSPYSSCGWILLSRWTGKCCRAAVRGWSDFVQSWRCSVKCTQEHHLLCFLFFLFRSYTIPVFLKDSIDVQFSEMLRKLYWRVFWCLSYLTHLTSSEFRSGLLLDQWSQFCPSCFMMTWLTTTSTLFLHIIW